MKGLSAGSPAFGLDAQMSSIPRLQLLRIFCLEKDSADASDSCHDRYFSWSRTSFSARSVYWRAIRWRQLNIDQQFIGSLLQIINSIVVIKPGRINHSLAECRDKAELRANRHHHRHEVARLNSPAF